MGSFYAVSINENNRFILHFCANYIFIHVNFKICIVFIKYKNKQHKKINIVAH